MARPRKFSVARQPNGQPRRASRTVRAAEEQSTVIGQRARLAASLGVEIQHPAHLLNQRWATERGRLRLRGVIDEDQFQTAEEIAKRHRRYLRALDARPPGGGGGADGDMSPRDCRVARARWGAVQRALAIFGNPDSRKAVLAVCVDDSASQDHVALRAGLDAMTAYLDRGH